MSRRSPLPLSEEWTDPDSYIDALLAFATSSDTFRNLCGGVHILDFLTREPDLYTTLLPADWREFFNQHDIHDILHLLLREDIDALRSEINDPMNGQEHEKIQRKWKDRAPFPPATLLDYIRDIRRFSLLRDFSPTHSSTREGTTTTIPGRIAVGMNVKKRHEVEQFAQYVDALCEDVKQRRGGRSVSHVVDFGSGQNYLGRTLASAYHRDIIAIERRHHNITGANRMDVKARLAKDKKKQERILQRRLEEKQRKRREQDDCEPCGPDLGSSSEQSPVDTERSRSVATNSPATLASDESPTVVDELGAIDLAADELSFPPVQNHAHVKTAGAEAEQDGPKGAMHYIEHDIKDGYLEPIIRHVVDPSRSVDHANESLSAPDGIPRRDSEQENPARVMVVSLHSCGNLLHHGIRSIALNPSVVAVAMIGCCYNLMTERLGPMTWKLPVLRSLHPRLKQTATAFDPHGFPMSKRLEEYAHESGVGIKLNITARMMAVQAPYNWGREDSEGFFKRHYYRALLQRIFVDRQIVSRPVASNDFFGTESKPAADSEADRSTNETDTSAGRSTISATGSGGTALIVGSLRKPAFTSFPAYVRAAVTRLSRDAHYGAAIQEELGDISDDEINRYEQEYFAAKKNLSVTWSLMAFSAAVVEAMIVVDRWQFLREQDSIRDCWVESVFEYSESPRNLAVIGIKE